MILPPSPSPRSNTRGRNTTMVKEKRKRIDGSGSLMLGADAHTRSSDGNVPARPEGSGIRDGSTRNENRKVVRFGSGTPSDERRPKKKRQNKPTGPPKLRIALPPTGPPDVKDGAEIIVLDDDVKVEPVEVNDPVTNSNWKVLGDNHDMGIYASAQIPESHQRHSTFQVHTGQTVKHHALQWKDSNRRIGLMLDPPNERATSNSHSGAGAWRTNDQGSGSHRPSVNSNGILRKKRSENDGHDIEPQSQQSSSRATTMPFSVTPVLQEQEQSSTGEHRLLVALTTLTTEKQVLEKKLHETMVSLKTQVFRAETSERKNSELEAQAQTSRENVSGLKKKMMGFQKFVDGLGKDYNMLNGKNSQLNSRLDEVLKDRDDLFRNLQDVKCLAEKVDGTVQGWGSSRAMLEGANREIEKRECDFGFSYMAIANCCSG